MNQTIDTYDQTNSEERILLWAAVSTKIQDKYSIEDQLKLGRGWCAQRRATIVEELVVRGFSRDYWTLADVVAAAAHDPDMEAFAKLQAHIRQKDFTVFACLDADRFGRTASLVHEVLGRITRDCNARVITLIDGVWIDEENAPVIGLIKGYKAQHDITRLKEYRATGMDNRAKEGKSIYTHVPLFHKIIRDEKGKEIGIVVDETLRPLWTDVASVLLRGLSWGMLEQVLFEEFGHGDDGKPYPKTYIRRQVLNYAFWGHSTINARLQKGRYVYRVGAWIWDERVPPPAPTTIYRNVYPAVYSGAWADLGEQVKAELWRRLSIRGKATSHGTHRFHGLVVCAECGFTMSHSHTERVTSYMRCDTHMPVKQKERKTNCTQRRLIPLRDIEAYFTEELQKRMDDLPSELFQTLSNAEAVQRQIDDLEKQKAGLSTEADNLTAELGHANDLSRKSIRKRMDELDRDTKQIERTLSDLELSLSIDYEVRQSQAGLLELLKEKGSIAWFWTQSDMIIHQYLSTALGGNQIVVENGIVMGSHPAHARILRKQQRRT